MWMKMGGLAAAALVLAAISSPAKADLIYSGTGIDSDGSSISATVDFSLVGNDFRIVLTNTSPSISQASVLTNLQVTTAPAPATALPGPSGTISLTSGSSLVSATIVDTTNSLGSEWAYLTGGIASSGFGVGTGTGNLCGTAICDGQALDGSAFGLVGSGTDLSLDGLASRTYVENSVTVDILLAAGSTFTLADIVGVQFQYGTGLGEGEFGGCTGDCTPTHVPEPASLAIFGTALAALGIIKRRRRTTPTQL